MSILWHRNPPAFRIPAGVRVDGEPVGGRFVALDFLPVLADATNDTGRAILLDFVAREIDATARGKQTAGKLARRDFLESLSDEIVSALVPPSEAGITEAPEESFPVEGIEELEELADEWEIGIDYRASRRTDVDVNVRVRRVDGRPFDKPEAVAVMRAMRDHFTRGVGPYLPRGYLVAAIDWRNPRFASRGWKTDIGESQLNIFRHVLGGSDDAQWYVRLGSVDDA